MRFLDQHGNVIKDPSFTEDLEIYIVNEVSKEQILPFSPELE